MIQSRTKYKWVRKVGEEQAKSRHKVGKSVQKYKARTKVEKSKLSKQSDGVSGVEEMAVMVEQEERERGA